MGKPALVLSSELIRAARALVRWEQRDLARASSVSLPTIKRAEIESGDYGGALVDRSCAQEGAGSGRRRIHRRERWRPRRPIAKAAAEKGLGAAVHEGTAPQP